MSALGVDRCKDSLYAISKFNAEKYIQKKSKNFLIIRPSLIFGPDDNFFNRFAKMTLLSPFLPLIMGGKTKFQPVYVEDVCKGIIKIIRLNNLLGLIGALLEIALSITRILPILEASPILASSSFFLIKLYVSAIINLFLSNLVYSSTFCGKALSLLS